MGLSTGIQELLNTVQTVGHIHSSGSCRPVLYDGTKKCRVAHVRIIDAEKVKRVLYKDTYTLRQPLAVPCTLLHRSKIKGRLVDTCEHSAETFSAKSSTRQTLQERRYTG